MTSKNPEQTEFQGEDISPSKDGYIFKEILREGTGDELPMFDDKVTVHYISRRLDEVEFDNSRQRDRPFSFSLGQGEVIKSWDIGIATMKRGELARFTSKPKYAFGQKGHSDKVGPNTIVVFEVELIDFGGKDFSPEQDGSIRRRMIKAGEGNLRPNEGATIEMMLKGMYNDQILEERTSTFILGEGCEENIPAGVEVCAFKMTTGEHCKLFLKSKGLVGLEKFNIPSDATVEYELKLIKVERVKDKRPDTDDEKLAESEILKTRADQLLKGSHYEVAIKKYKKIYEYLLSAIFSHDSDRQRCKYLKIASQSNLAICYMKMNNYDDAKRTCNRALAFDDKNEKYFETVLKLNPLNAATKQQIQICEQQIKAHEVEEKQIYKKIFHKSPQANASNKANRIETTSCGINQM
ncbi:unnamed protein product [Rotaria magnacalcarata]|uniref:peptidylprolyl isomerase n=1 Tax=Rotaria magnacalcarata TaxID=392030 RepID=A0A816LQY9_9BILA|nr:unnamed protein product [Rotaria magnacalcarata]CAF1955377.1 unnamed protein product [Rotaria magnacalcarata]